METSSSGVLSVLAELKDYLLRSGASSEGIDLRRAVEMLGYCKRIDASLWSSEDRSEFIRCSVAILSLL